MVLIQSKSAAIRPFLITAIVFFSGVTLWCQQDQSGLASYYHDSLEGNSTASGEIFYQNKFTAAHKKLPFDTWVEVTDDKGHQVVVRVNDRLPRRSSRMIDLTWNAALELDLVRQGLKQVELKVISARQAWAWFIEKGFLKPIAMLY